MKLFSERVDEKTIAPAFDEIVKFAYFLNFRQWTFFSPILFATLISTLLFLQKCLYFNGAFAGARGSTFKMMRGKFIKILLVLDDFFGRLLLICAFY
jgi:hypothetical protein